MQQEQEVILNYELLLRPFGQGEGFASGKVFDSLSKAGFEFTREKPILADFALRDGKLKATQFTGQDSEQVAHEDLIMGLNLEFSMGLSRADADMAVAKIFELSQDLGALVFDPQAGQEVGPSSHNLVMDTWQRSVGFQADVVGSVTMGGSSPDLLGYKDNPKSRLGLYVLGILALLMLVYMARRCSGASETANKPYVNDFTTSTGGK